MSMDQNTIKAMVGSLSQQFIEKARVYMGSDQRIVGLCQGENARKLADKLRADACAHFGVDEPEKPKHQWNNGVTPGKAKRKP